MQGLILRSAGLWYDLKSSDGSLWKARLRGKLKTEDFKFTNPIAVGDYVEFELETAGDVAIISDILDRENYILRLSTHKSSHRHIIAANIDQAFLIATLAMPRTSFGFLDRFLAAAESFRIPVTLIFNKSDILDKEELAYQQQICELYQSLGYGAIAISALTHDVATLKELFTNKKTLVAGHSGVGKSTLINKIAPHLKLETSKISNFSKKGVHTTTFAEMHQIDDTTYLIDTPGIKEFGMADMDKYEISHYFPEMRAMLNKCRYQNCLHLQEPDCAVLQAVDKGKIALTRYESYLSIVSGDDNRK